VTAETKSHDAWFRSKVKEALNDGQAATPHTKVMNLVQALINEKRRQQS
jgi:DNA-damage-inducible protein J